MSKRIRIHKNAPRTDYPITKVILSYAFWGGGLGGALLATWLMFGVKTHEPTNFLAAWVLAIFLFGLYGSVIAHLPAALCGVLIVCCRLRRNLWGLLAAAVIGALCGAVYGYVLFQRRYSNFMLNEWLEWAILSAATAFVLACFVLPKRA
ncbi:MAG: hypothetical protein Q4B82_03805 [Alysiella sp.]|uniref:hypothetical protein n=1 Tax=Alysiella sp. TaxID=1872483 RepID=UPI0026DA7162|nr:hypothetical protein [Alysiella sp.]MDO4433685.1 hypothetical protein [Alysiella sp.]